MIRLSFRHPLPKGSDTGLDHSVCPPAGCTVRCQLPESPESMTGCNRLGAQKKAPQGANSTGVNFSLQGQSFGRRWVQM